MYFSLQSFPSTVMKFLTKTLENKEESRRSSDNDNLSEDGLNRLPIHSLEQLNLDFFLLIIYSFNYPRVLNTNNFFLFYYLELNLTQKRACLSNEILIQDDNKSADLSRISLQLTSDNIDIKIVNNLGT